MLVSLSWLQEFAPVGDDTEMLAEVMTDLGMVVEDIIEVGDAWDGIIVARVLSLNRHPNADKIQLVGVDVGDGQSLQICCGAFNMAEGDLVPLATVGTTMPNGMEIAARALRGEDSNGMLCSAPELGIDGTVDGIEILPDDAPLGQPLVELLGDSSDTVFDLDLEGNRPDALSVAGVARDVAARLGIPFSPRSSALVETTQSAAAMASVEIMAPDLCPRFGIRVLTDLQPAESPSWMKSRLAAAGMRPISPIVDISNYVMLELGQPNHTYDLDKVPDGRIGVRMAREGETLVTLDAVERTLTPDDGVIVDANDRAIGLAGVMGGESTEISDSTSSVLLEAAVWDRMTVAKTSRRLNLRSEASTRCERGVDYAGIETALDRFCELAADICSAQVSAGTIIEEGNLVPAPVVRARTERINHILNLSLTDPEIVTILDPIGYTTTVAEAGQLDVQVPTWRPDSTIEADIIEEVGRHHGYSKSGRRVPRPPQTGRLTHGQKSRRRIRTAMMALGYSETMPMPFLAPHDLTGAGLPDDGITLANPLVVEESVLRTSLLPGLLKTVRYNQSHRAGPLRLFELGTVYHASDHELPDEPEWVGAISTGFSDDGAAAETAVRSLRGLAAALGLVNVIITNTARAGMHPTRSGRVNFRGRTVGEVGEIDPRVTGAYGVKGRVGWIQLDTKVIIEAMRSVPKQKPVSRFPSSEIDLSFVVADEVPTDKVRGVIAKAGGKLLREVSLASVFRSPDMEGGTRSLTYSLRFQSDEATLTDDELTEARQSVIDAVTKAKLGSLRN